MKIKADFEPAQMERNLDFDSGNIESLSPFETPKGTIVPEQLLQPLGDVDVVLEQELRHDLTDLVEFLKSPEATETELGEFFDKKYQKFLMTHPGALQHIGVQQLKEYFGKNYQVPLLQAAEEILKGMKQ